MENICSAHRQRDRPPRPRAAAAWVALHPEPDGEHLLYYLKEGGEGDRESKRYLHSTGSLLKKAATAELWSPELYLGLPHGLLEPSAPVSAAFLGALSRSWIRNRAAWSQIPALMWDAGVTDSGWTCCTSPWVPLLTAHFLPARATLLHSHTTSACVLPARRSTQ